LPKRECRDVGVVTYWEATKHGIVAGWISITSAVIYAHITAIVDYFLNLVGASRTINTAGHLASRWGILVMSYYKFVEVV
jgi:hypothetical protein